jgi:hypothetical protein
MRIRIERRKQSKQREQQKNTKTPSLKSLMNWVDLEAWRGFDLWNVSWSECYCSCIECELQKTWMPLKEVVEWGIYSLQPLPSHWLFLLSMGTSDSLVVHRTCTVHCPVRATSARSLGFGAVDRWSSLSCSCTGQSGGTPDMSDVSWLAALTSDHTLFTSLFTFAIDRCV